MTAVARARFAPFLRAKTSGRLAFLAFLAALFGYGGVFAYAMLTNFDVVNLHRDALLDDAFYYFEIARNLAAGEFSTFDGGITRTNGYHPAWLLLVTPFYWVFDGESALFGIKALEIMLIAGAVALVAVAVRYAALPWILLFAALPLLYHTEGMLGGTEAAVGAFSLGALLLAAVLTAQDPARWRGTLAGVVFLLPWVRLEYAAIGLFATCAMHLLPSPGPRWPGRRHFGWSRLRADGLPMFAAVTGILAYFLYNGIAFGGIVPISGATKLAWGAEWREAEGTSLWQYWPTAVEAFCDRAQDDVNRLLELCCYLLAASLVAAFRRWRDEDRPLLAVLIVMLALVVETLAVRWQVAFFYSPSLARYTHWYYAPGYFAAALMVPVRCFVAIFLWRALTRDGGPLIRHLGVSAICVAGIYAAFDRHSLAEPFRFVQEKVAYSHVEPNDALGPEIAALEDLLPDDAILGSWDAGAVGYFLQRPVVNLDGLANSYEYKDVRAEWGLTHQINSVLDKDLTPRGYEYVGPRQRGGRLKLWRYGQNGSRSEHWLSITSPSVGADGADNGLRMLQLGRLLVMFVPDCQVEAVSNVPEMLTFSWREGARSRLETRLWPQPLRTELGYCTQRFLLPHGAAAAEVAVDATTAASFVAGKAPVVRSTYDVYAVGRQLVYIRKACAGDDAYNFLHIEPSVPRHLPYRLREVGFVNHDYLLNVERRVSGGRCLALAELPVHETGEVRTGQLADGELAWQARIDGLALRPGSVAAALANAESIAQGDIDVYLDQKGRRLFYVQTSSVSPACRAEDVFLHFHPRRVGDLPTWQRELGFANGDFNFESAGFDAGGRCVAVMALPEFDLDHLKTGVMGTNGHAWHFSGRVADRLPPVIMLGLLVAAALAVCVVGAACSSARGMMLPPALRAVLPVVARHRRPLLAFAAVLPWLALLAWLAETAWFLTDDAFISFRYARNLLEGNGLVFNVGERVEGYSNFLWVLELAALWGAFGLRPEHAAPWLSVAFTVGTLAVMAWWIWRLPGLRQRGVAAWMALGLVCGSATFAVWTSGGGLETRQFTFFVVLAVACLAPGRASRGLLAAASLSLAAASLTRPEGPLLAACCFAWYGVQRRVDTGRWLGVDWAWLAVPFAAVVAGHYLFRYGYYGEWLPNTYYAKFVRPWYDMGLRYLAAAALETGLYLLLPLAGWALVAGWRRRRSLAHGLPLLCVVAHMVYVARVGGDHFEWRPLDFYWPLLAVPAAAGVLLCARGTAAALKRRLRRRPGHVRASRLPVAGALAVALFCPVLFYASALQAALLFEGAKIDTRVWRLEITLKGGCGLLAAPGMATLNVVAERLRSRLIAQDVGLRLAEHREFAAVRLREWQPYEQMERGLIPADAVATMSNIGVAAFYLPDLTIIDAFGLTDATVARHGASPNARRSMAHDRSVPLGYLEERGVNFTIHPAGQREWPGDHGARYAIEAGPRVWMQFDAPDHEWVTKRFDLARLRIYADPGVANRNWLMYEARCYVGDRLLLQFKDGAANWHTEGGMFNHRRHAHVQLLAAYRGGNVGPDFLTSFHPTAGSESLGRALSPEFAAAADALLSFRIAGSSSSRAGLRLRADGEQVAVWHGRGLNLFGRIDQPLADFAGKRLELELFDGDTGDWGYIMLDQVLIARPASGPPCPY